MRSRRVTVQIIFAKSALRDYNLNICIFIFCGGKFGYVFSAVFSRTVSGFIHFVAPMCGRVAFFRWYWFYLCREASWSLQESPELNFFSHLSFGAMGGENELFFCAMLHEFRHAYQQYLIETLENMDSDDLVAQNELNKLSDGIFPGKFCFFGLASEEGCHYGSTAQGYVDHRIIRKWADIGHGFLIDPVNSNYTKNDFNLLPNSSFKDGQKDKRNEDKLTDTYAAREADAQLFGWWFHTLPTPEKLPEYPAPAIFFDSRLHIGPNISGVRILTLQGGVRNRPAACKIKMVIEGEDCTLSATGGAQKQKCNANINNNSIAIQLHKKYDYCFNADEHVDLRYTEKSGRIWFVDEEGYEGPETPISYKFTGLEEHPLPEDKWRCR